MNEKKSHIIKAFNGIGFTISDKQAEQFLSYYELLVEWNEKMNLTAITEFEDVVVKHFLDSAYGGQVYSFGEDDTVLDLGTGAGFPGIPLKILYPETTFVLMDSLQKRINFLNEVVETLGLENVETCHGRAEDFGHRKEYREQYDLCTSRAVANLSTLSEYCVPFVKIGGQFVSYKSGNVDNELRESEKAIRILGGEIGKVCSFVLPETDFARTLVPIKKIKATGKKYPRKAGTPSKEPLQ